MSNLSSTSGNTGKRHEERYWLRVTHARPTTQSNGDENANVDFSEQLPQSSNGKGFFRLLTDPDFLHAGDQVHLGPGVTAQRQTSPSIELDELPSPDGILLSHCHAGHFDQVAEVSRNRDFLVITTPHAQKCLTSKDDPFRNVKALEFFYYLKLKAEGAEIGTEVTIPIHYNDYNVFLSPLDDFKKAVREARM
ncbi:hypothetical protein FZEAL_6683 [Fusarium zealandicum]|uniref:Metallo-beta-lactamase domain-containing protein n=1 Tax=Fusarium zealandicum TaxID=1053134 RepID=A0A8H4UIA5_9HYPO|nr:hypothetical protein FZEAL_6683 [Fusarium zealandicum]